MIAPVISWYFRQRYEEIFKQAEKAIDFQHDLLDELLEKAEKTEYGVKYGFKKIADYEQFRKQVPLTDYEDLKPWVERIMKGEQGVLWPTPINWFAKSSGTTGNTEKFIPLSFESIEETHYKGGRDILSVYCGQHPETRMFEGKGLLIGGSHKINQMNSNAFYGDLSAVLMNHLPLWANLKSTPDLSIALMENWEEKVEKIAQATQNENVTSISGVPTWTIVLFNRLLEITGKQNMHEVWPNLELFIHGGVSFAPYRKQFEQYLPLAKMNYVETYNASEGFFGLQCNQNSTDLLLMTQHGVFYEFYPVSLGPEYCIPLWEVQPNINYAMVITTNSGLWRYKIGDTVQFSSTQPYNFKITGRTKLFINAFGEELVIENADTAMARACSMLGAEVADYTAAPVYLDSEDAGHQWLVEFEKEPSDFEKFIDILDQELKNCNTDYAAKRHADLAMKRPKVHAVPKGAFHAWLKSKGKLGGQHKVPRLSNNRQVMDEILGFLQQEKQ